MENVNSFSFAHHSAFHTKWQTKSNQFKQLKDDEDELNKAFKTDAKIFLDTFYKSELMLYVKTIT